MKRAGERAEPQPAWALTLRAALSFAGLLGGSDPVATFADFALHGLENRFGTATASYRQYLIARLAEMCGSAQITDWSEALLANPLLAKRIGTFLQSWTEGAWRRASGTPTPSGRVYVPAYRPAAEAKSEGERRGRFAVTR